MKQCFRKLKQALCEDVIMHTPNFGKTFVLQTDASETAVGAVLTQEEKGIERPIAYASRKLTPAEKRCNSSDSDETIKPQTYKADNCSGVPLKGPEEPKKLHARVVSRAFIRLSGRGGARRPGGTKGSPAEAAGRLKGESWSAEPQRAGDQPPPAECGTPPRRGGAGCEQRSGAPRSETTRGEVSPMSGAAVSGEPDTRGSRRRYSCAESGASCTLHYGADGAGNCGRDYWGSREDICIPRKEGPGQHPHWERHTRSEDRW
ncbi:uncharacterized protein LOC109281530 isoform X3 [Alligator mississippiensis]|uniref:uncharacterized protein LOC109281530 isoform X3 n=1 Tax=Alligator mississippiensis TaxID=8496 RepID=UPI00287800E2|nr:uncharacterized protein LOC109281530 isoform X3 [Alligator mississippiensis]